MADKPLSAAAAMAVDRASTALAQGNPLLAAQLCHPLIGPGSPAALWRVFAEATLRLGDFTASEQAFAQAARLEVEGSPKKARMLLARAEPLICLGMPTEAAACAREARAMGLDTPKDCFSAALAFSHLGLPADALPLAEQAVEGDPDRLDAWFLVGNARQFLGDIKGAQAAFDLIVRRSRDQAAAAYYSLAHLRRWTAQDNHVAAMEGFNCRTAEEASRIGYALFKEYDDLGDTAKAWDCLTHGAEIARTMENWTSAEERATFDAWRTAFPAGSTPVADHRPRSGPRRIFIVGLPRSGTTLVERVLASHSAVQTIGEVNTFAIVTRRLSGISSGTIIDPAIIAASAAIDPLALAESYSAEVAYLSDGSPFTIDKRPDNYQYLPLIRRAFPDAVIIVLRRDPMDSLFGALKRRFAPGSHGWSYSLADLAAHFANYSQLVEDWRLRLGNGCIEVSLEELIADPDRQIRSLLDRCGLDFEEACLSPHTAKGAVTTASSVQVRRPINADGVGAWRRYAAELAPLRELLARQSGT